MTRGLSLFVLVGSVVMVSCHSSTGSALLGDSGAGASGGMGAGGNGAGGTSGTSGTGGTGGTGGASGGAAGSASFGCQVNPSQCTDGIDNDGDGLIDGADPECSGPCDNDEGTFSTGIPGDN